jgi:hypothetical protein
LCLWWNALAVHANNEWIKRPLSKEARVVLLIVAAIIFIFQLHRTGFVISSDILQWIMLNGPTLLAVAIIIIALWPWLILPFKIGANICIRYSRFSPQVIISTIVFAFFVSHLLWPERIALDTVVLAIIVIMILPWLSPLIRHLELPGGFKIEFPQAVQNVEKQATEAGLIPTLPSQKAISARRSGEDDDRFTFQRIVDEDPAIALAGLRIEIERRLVKLAGLLQIDISKTGISMLLTALGKREALTHEEIVVLRDLIRLLNQAAHGADIRKDDAMKAIEIGINILTSLDNKVAEFSSLSERIEIA